MKLLIGVAWREAVKSAPDRAKYGVSLDLGILPALVCRIVENTKRSEDKENQPTHLMFFSPTEGEDVKVGAFWPCEGKPYLTGQIETAAFGKARLKGGAEVDFRLTGERIPVRFQEVPADKRTGEKSPTHQLWRMTYSKADSTPAEEEIQDEPKEELVGQEEHS